MTLAEHFPASAKAFPNLLPWQSPFDWIIQGQFLAEAVFELQMKLQESDNQLDAFCEALRADVEAETIVQTDPSAAAMIDGFRFVTSQVQIYRTMTSGRLGTCYHWLLWSISREHVFDRTENHAEYRLPPYASATRAMNGLALEVAVDWVWAAYIVAHKFGGLDGHCSDFLEASLWIARRAGSGNGVQALTAIAVYSAAKKLGSTQAQVDALLECLDHPEVPAADKAKIQIAMSTNVGYYTDTHPAEWARRTLCDLRQELKSHEPLQLLAVTLQNQEAWLSARAEILSEIQSLTEVYRLSYSRHLARIALDSRILLVHPIIAALCKFGSTDDLMAVLHAWYAEPDAVCADGDILFICPNHGDGVAYVWPDGRYFASGSVADSLENALVANSNALNEYFRGPQGDRQVTVDDRLKSTPAFEFAAEIWKAMDDHYKLSEVTSRLPQGWVPRSVVVMPAHRDPLQAMILDRVGWVAPLETSLGVADALRPIKTLSIWPGATQTTDAEVEVLAYVAGAAGWHVKVTSGTLDREAFRQFYEDAEADLLWVIGHGEQVSDDLSRTGIVMEDGDMASLADITSFDLPGEGRRLLVLNICSSATAQTFNGMARSGLAQELVSPRQQVIGHLWPIDYYAALAFGSSLAVGLIREPPPAALRAASLLMRDQVKLINVLTEISPDLQAIQRLSGQRAAEVTQNVLSWGCPVILT
ncbi:CHAT domain-containing protein [Rhizobium leguminosarum]|uniref:CHAT domain-containing protein n=1 Tax=Rhizobium leguminosarum TaxID=384 RepID=UPI00103C482B|nr:CHAT domain-containing protein [Rhizobium leguminosarum]TBY46758.1 CHAT domain-containing protein [Rhizobium leguminosarum bv. viciae]